jgi:ABC-type transporter Mla MlaB component
MPDGKADVVGRSGLWAEGTIVLGTRTPCGADPKLDIELVGGVRGSHVRMSGDIVSGTRTAIWGIESLLMNEARVTFDLSDVTSMDGVGLEALLSLMDSVRVHGGSLVIGREWHSVQSFEELR